MNGRRVLVNQCHRRSPERAERDGARRERRIKRRIARVRRSQFGSENGRTAQVFRIEADRGRASDARRPCRDRLAAPRRDHAGAGRAASLDGGGAGATAAEAAACRAKAPASVVIRRLQAEQHDAHRARARRGDRRHRAGDAKNPRRRRRDRSACRTTCPPRSRARSSRNWRRTLPTRHPRIFEACNFQDLIGQRVTKVMTSLKSSRITSAACRRDRPLRRTCSRTTPAQFCTARGSTATTATVRRAISTRCSAVRVAAADASRYRGRRITTKQIKRGDGEAPRPAPGPPRRRRARRHKSATTGATACTTKNGPPIRPTSRP